MRPFASPLPFTCLALSTLTLPVFLGCGSGTAQPTYGSGGASPRSLNGGDSGATSVTTGSGGNAGSGVLAEAIAGNRAEGVTPVEHHGQLRVEEGQLVDESGTPVQLKGASSMWLNWETDGYAENLEGVRWMRDNWNLSLIRAAMGIEPEGAFLTDPDRALGQVRAIVDNAIELGIYVIIDWHDHEAQLRQSDAETFFLQMAVEYGETPNVIYEPFNEPLQISWQQELRPYHQSIVDSIRTVDSDNLIILGTPNWSQYVDEAAAAPVSGTNLLYTLHFYSCTHTVGLRSRADRALQNGIGLFVTEWGATHADGGVDELVCLDEAQRWHDWMNEKGISWAAWKFDNCRDSTCYFGPAGAPVAGPFTDEVLSGHAPFVRDRMIE